MLRPVYVQFGSKQKKVFHLSQGLMLLCSFLIVVIYIFFKCNYAINSIIKELYNFIYFFQMIGILTSKMIIIHLNVYFLNKNYDINSTTKVFAIL